MKKGLFTCLSLALLMLLSGCGAKEASYIGNRNVQYDDAKKCQRVFFGFYAAENSDPITQEADISIEITNDDGAKVYSNTIHVDETNYAEWTNVFAGTRMLGSVEIPDSEIEKGTVATGTLSVAATLPSGNAFDPEQISVYNLPMMDLSIQVPELPVTITNFGWEGAVEKTGELQKIEFNYQYGCEVTAFLKLLSNENTETSSDYFYVPYKVKDKDGVVVETGQLFFGPLSVGDTAKVNTYMGNLKLGEDYVIEFSDYSWN